MKLSKENLKRLEKKAKALGIGFYTKEFGLNKEITKEQERNKRIIRNEEDFYYYFKVTKKGLEILGNLENEISKELIKLEHRNSYFKELVPLINNKIIVPLCSCKLLLENGYFNEVGVILRSVTDALFLFVYFNKKPKQFQKWFRGTEFAIGNIKDELKMKNDPLYLKYKELCNCTHVKENMIGGKISAPPNYAINSAFRVPVFTDISYKKACIIYVSIIIEAINKIGYFSEKYHIITSANLKKSFQKFVEEFKTSQHRK